MYFGTPVHNAIVQYQQSDSFVEKNRLASNVILPALSKLVENRIHHAKFYNYGTKNYSQIKYDCVCHLVDRLDKFDPSKGYKAFSYFDKITRNWIWANMKQFSKEIEEHKDLDCVDMSRNVVNEVAQEEYSTDLQEFTHHWSKWCITNLERLFDTKRDRRLANAVFNLFQNCQIIDNYNKKALYIMIREQVDVKTHLITGIIKTIRPLQKKMFQEYIETGTKYWGKFLKPKEKTAYEKASQNRRSALYNR